MMHRCGWGTKESQERILARDISREGFNERKFDPNELPVENEYYVDESTKERLGMF